MKTAGGKLKFFLILYTFYCLSSFNFQRQSITRSFNRNLKLKEKQPFTDSTNELDVLENLKFEAKLNPNFLDFDDLEYSKLLMELDIPRSGNFWEHTAPLYESLEGKDDPESLETMRKLIQLVKFGFKKRYISDLMYQRRLSLPQDQLQSEVDNFGSDHLSLEGIIHKSAIETIDKFDKLVEKKYRTIQNEFIKTPILKKTFLSRLLPEDLYKSLVYLKTLYKPPDSKVLAKNTFVGALFSLFSYSNNRLFMVPVFLVFAGASFFSSLISRNAPTKKPSIIGVSFDQLRNFSSSSIMTAASIVIGSLISSLLVLYSFASLISLQDPFVNFRISLSISMMCVAVAVSFFEVFETKERDGWRWRKALSQLQEKKVAEAQDFVSFGKENDPTTEEYEDDYDQVTDQYLLSKEDQRKLREEEIDEDTPPDVLRNSKKAYEGWLEKKRNASLPPIEELPEGSTLLGAREGFFLKESPYELSNLFEKIESKKSGGMNPSESEKSLNKEVKAKFKGPTWFRDKAPSWLLNLRNQALKSRYAIGTELARDFGVYRKAMYKVDSQVVLQPSDGVNELKTDEFLDEDEFMGDDEEGNGGDEEILTE